MEIFTQHKIQNYHVYTFVPKETDLPLSFKESTKLYEAYIMTASRQSAYVIN